MKVDGTCLWESSCGRLVVWETEIRKNAATDLLATTYVSNLLLSGAVQLVGPLKLRVGHLVDNVRMNRGRLVGHLYPGST